jgi:hypothetical protein
LIIGQKAGDALSMVATVENRQKSARMNSSEKNFDDGTQFDKDIG